MSRQEHSDGILDSASTSRREFPGYENFWLWSEPVARNFRVKVEGDKDRLRRVLRSARGEAGDVRAYWFMGRQKPSDLVCCSGPEGYLISPRIVDVLKSIGATGWRPVSAAVFGPKEEPIEGYSWLAVTSRPVAIDYSQSEFIREFGPSDELRGLYFVASDWDGSDVFAGTETRDVFATSRVRDALIKAKVTGILWKELMSLTILPLRASRRT